MKRYQTLLLLTAMAITAIGCQSQTPSPDAADHPHEHGALSVTIWTGKTELFMEYPIPVVGQELAFAVHLTVLENNAAVEEGTLTFWFTHESGRRFSVIEQAPASPGIYRPVVKFSEPGTYDVRIQLQGRQVIDSITVPNFVVFQNESAIIPEAESDHAPAGIAFLKEQQWNIAFQTEPATHRSVTSSVSAIGEILPYHNMHAEVPAPLSGAILADRNTDFPHAGAWVKQGDILAVISPPANTESNLHSIRSEYLIAQSEFERAQRLFAKQAIPEKRLEHARLQLEALQASYNVITRLTDVDDALHDASASLHMYIRAPISGILEGIHFHLGQSIQAGENLFTITNPKQLLLKAHVPLAHIGMMQQVKNATFRVEGYAQEFEIQKLGGRLVAIGSVVEEGSRTVPVTFAFQNPDNILKIGMFAEVSLKTTDVRETLTVPVQALYDDNGRPVVFVQITGEQFERRTVVTGALDRGYMEIHEGLSENERVVTVGVYQVHLASLSTDAPTGHGHPH